ncbi:kinase D-interacting substrate of 220 kDa-like isoform X4 [Anopheles albimanus]|uniref:kinase D-interacting substrate of 220 kDa-like isoform X4 n=1 Tax=Anopheles albimanus TaxID=7167 RepID=UPI00163F960E|nr:kinase D-interacting substrate of 220 kDa-like isoform X4 [Anopheles albimanus]
MDNDRSYDHVRALVSSIHGSFAAAATQQLEDALDRTNNNSPLLATTPSSPERQQQQQQQQHVEQSSRPVSPTDGREERVAADGAATTPRGITEPGGPAETTATSSPVAVAASVTATASSRSSTPTRLLHHRLRIPSLVVTSSLSPYHPGNLLAGVASTADPDHTQHRRFSFAIMRRHSNTALNRCDSMGSIGHRTLLQFLETDDLAGMKTFLGTRHLQVDDRDENNTTVLMVACGLGAASFVKELIARGADVQAQDLDNWTPMHFAAKAGHVEIVEMLLENGAQLEARDMGGWTPLMWSSYKGHTQCCSLLLQNNADFAAHGNYHLNPLLWASGRGHTEIVRLLVNSGAKVNVGDKYGTTPLVWACRKGKSEIVDILLKAGANVDTAGMYSWTPLLVSVSGGFQECVTLLLERKPNVNALDKDGMTALSIACREGQTEIASALIAAGAYLNVQDRAGDTPLINAVKGGHRTVVDILMKRHVDVDIQGKDKKTALYMAVEKGHTAIVKLILQSNPDLELSTKDGDTALLRAVRNRNLEIVQMLLERKAKVGATDKRGDTCLHVAMRARSKAIVEALLSNPKYGQLLYRSNKEGETPYAIDAAHQKTILGQVFGNRRLNANEDSEGMLGYGLYSSALADVLSEPTLTTPITVGLYAKWGSGKSFLLAKLREEMKTFAHSWSEPQINASWLFFLICLHLAIVIGTVVGLASGSYVWGLATAGILLVLIYALEILFNFLDRRYDLDWLYVLSHAMSRKLGRLRLILQVAFCHPPGPKNDQQPMPVRFHFAEASSAAPNGEAAVALMLASLFDAIELHYGSLPTGLYRAFRPRPLKANGGWKWRKMCCMPVVLVFELGLLGVLATASLAIIHSEQDIGAREEIAVTIYVLLGFLLAGAIANLHAWSKLAKALFMSQGKHLKQAFSNNEAAPLTALGAEVSLMTDMVRCLDAFTGQQSRLVGVVDALDSCDTERTLTILNAIQTLLSGPQRPFVLLLAVDPHVIAKAAEANSRRLFTEGGIGGHDFLRNLVHLPVYLQNSGLRKVQRAQNTALNTHRRMMPDMGRDDDQPTGHLGHSASARRLSNASEIMSSQEKLRAMPGSSRGGSKKLRVSDSIASSIGSNLHKLGQNPPMDLSKIILTDDYFSDVNPRSMRRLMNVIYITVRLLKAFQIEFSWYRLSSWINLTEQWPLRASMIVLEHDQAGDSIDDSVSLQTVYDKVRPKLTCLREAVALLDLDRDERKLDAFLQLHKSDLLVSDLRIFLPFTINLDPYLRKVLKEDQQAMEDEGIIIPMKSTLPPLRPSGGGYVTGTRHHHAGILQHSAQQQQQQQVNNLANWPNFYNPQPAAMALMNYYNQNLANLLTPAGASALLGDALAGKQQQNAALNSALSGIERNDSDQHSSNVGSSASSGTIGRGKGSFHQKASNGGLPATVPPIDIDLSNVQLSTLTVDQLIELLEKVTDLKPAMERTGPILRENAISGRVLMYCNLEELKSVLNLSFGHWEMFKLLITALRESNQATQPAQRKLSKTTSFAKGTNGGPNDTIGELQDPIAQSTPPFGSASSSFQPIRQKSQNLLEKQQPAKVHDYEYLQVTLEEQMICGALQTLNEDAFEDVVSSERASPTVSMRSSPVPVPRQTASILKPTGSIRKGDVKRVTMCDSDGNLTPTFIEVLNEKLSKSGKLSVKRQYSFLEPEAKRGS